MRNYGEPFRMEDRSLLELRTSACGTVCFNTAPERLGSGNVVGSFPQRAEFPEDINSHEIQLPHQKEKF